MSHIDAVCDGSHSTKFGISGVAYFIDAQNSPAAFSSLEYAVASNCETSSEAERCALLLSIKALNKIDPYLMDDIDTVHIHTDHLPIKNFIEHARAGTLKPYQKKPEDDPNLQALLQEINAFETKHKVVLSIKYVQAHVVDRAMSRIEKIHSRVDKGAVKARNTAEKQILNPEKGQFYSVILPEPPWSKEQKKEFKELGYSMGKRGVHLRYALSSAQMMPDNSLSAGVEKAASEMGLPASTLMTHVSGNTYDPTRDNAIDLALLKQYYHANNMHVSTKPEMMTRANKNANALSATFSRLIYGERGGEGFAFNGASARVEGASQLLVDLDPDSRKKIRMHSLSACASRFMPNVNMQYVHYDTLPHLQAVIHSKQPIIAALQNTPPTLTPHPRADSLTVEAGVKKPIKKHPRHDPNQLIAPITKMLKEYASVLESGQLKNKAHTIARDMGFPRVKSLENAFNVLCEMENVKEELVGTLLSKCVIVELASDFKPEPRVNEHALDLQREKRRM
jgi:ribonuclease HI